MWCISSPLVPFRSHCSVSISAFRAPIRHGGIVVSFIPRALLSFAAAALLAGCTDRHPISPTGGSASGDPAFSWGGEAYGSEINRNDFRVTYDAVREQTTLVRTDEPVYNAATQQHTTSLYVSPPGQLIDVDAGYDHWGRGRVNEYRDIPAADQYLEPVYETTRIPVVGDEVYGFDRGGNSHRVEPYPGSEACGLEELGSTANGQATDGVVIDERDQREVIAHGINPSWIRSRSDHRDDRGPLQYGRQRGHGSFVTRRRYARVD